MIARLFRRLFFGTTSESVSTQITKTFERLNGLRTQAIQSEANIKRAISSLAEEQGTLEKQRAQIEKMIGQ